MSEIEKLLRGIGVGVQSLLYPSEARDLAYRAYALGRADGPAWLRIADMPEEWKDGRPVLLRRDTAVGILVISDLWSDRGEGGWCDWYCAEGDPTHAAAIGSLPEE